MVEQGAVMRFEGTLQTVQNMIDNSRGERELSAIVQGLSCWEIKNRLNQRVGVDSTLTRLLKEELKQRTAAQS